MGASRCFDRHVAAWVARAHSTILIVARAGMSTFVNPFFSSSPSGGPRGDDAAEAEEVGDEELSDPALAELSDEELDDDDSESSIPTQFLPVKILLPPQKPSQEFLLHRHTGLYYYGFLPR